jgi:hypothetical protein
VEEVLLDIISWVKKGDTGREVRQALAAMEGETYEITMVDAAEVLVKAVVRQARANN